MLTKPNAASTAAHPPRHNYPTVDAYKTAVTACKSPSDLTSLYTKLRLGAQSSYAGIHPFREGDADYTDCWKAVFAHMGKQKWAYDKRLKKFFVPGTDPALT